MAVTRKTLRDARDSGKPVQLRRKGVLQVSGLVLGVGQQWCGVLTLSGQVMLLRNADIRRVRTAHEPRADKLERTAARHRVAMLDLTDTRGLLFTAGSLAPVLDLRCEQRRRVIVGNVVRVGRKRVEVLPQRPDGWAPESLSLRHKHITRIVLPICLVQVAGLVRRPRGRVALLHLVRHQPPEHEVPTALREQAEHPGEG